MREHYHILGNYGVSEQQLAKLNDHIQTQLKMLPKIQKDQKIPRLEIRLYLVDSEKENVDG